MSTRSLRYNTLDLHTPKGRMLSGVDSDAGAFLEAAQIFNTRQQQAIFELVTNMKRYGLWSKMKAIYPFVGGTASSHKWNLKDPRNVDAAFRLTFDGGWTHSSTGADPNGTNAIADTNLIPSTSLTKYSTHASIYLRENTDGIYFDIGATNTGSTEIISIYARLSNATLADTGNYTISRISATNTDSRGLFTVKRSSATDLKIFKNGTQLGSNTSNDTANLPSFKIYLGAAIIGTNNVGTQWSNREIAFATIGDGLTDDDARNLYNIVDLYQRRLGRAV